MLDVSVFKFQNQHLQEDVTDEVSFGHSRITLSRSISYMLDVSPQVILRCRSRIIVAELLALANAIGMVSPGVESTGSARSEVAMTLLRSDLIGPAKHQLDLPSGFVALDCSSMYGGKALPHYSAIFFALDATSLLTALAGITSARGPKEELSLFFPIQLSA